MNVLCLGFLFGGGCCGHFCSFHLKMLRQGRGEYARDGERGRTKEGVSDYVSKKKKGMLDSVLKKLWH